MIETTLKLNAKDYIGRPDLVLCNGARVSFIYCYEMYIPRGADYADVLLYSGVYLTEYRPPRRVCLDRQSQFPKLVELVDLPF